jgi:hypothetical protein
MLTVRDFLGNDVPYEVLQRIIDEADILHDRRVSYLEFLELWDTESEEKMADMTDNVMHRRRIVSQASSVSSAISTGSSHEGPAELDHVGDLPEIVGIHAEHFFQKQRQMSVRGDWV